MTLLRLEEVSNEVLVFFKYSKQVLPTLTTYSSGLRLLLLNSLWGKTKFTFLLTVTERVVIRTAIFIKSRRADISGNHHKIWATEHRLAEGLTNLRVVARYHYAKLIRHSRMKPVTDSIWSKRNSSVHILETPSSVVECSLIRHSLCSMLSSMRRSAERKEKNCIIFHILQ